MPQRLPLLATFTPISLAALNQKAELMERRDNKYILTTEKLNALLAHCLPNYDLLTIHHNTQFKYHSLYFDTGDFKTHHEHNQGKRRRIKVRWRHYVNTDLHFFEVKLKGFRKQTKKYRVPITPEEIKAGQLSERLRAFMLSTIEKHYGETWGKAWLKQLQASIRVDYHRITLVSKQGQERITIDNRIQYSAPFSATPTQPPAQELDPNKWVVEVKSERGRTATDRFLFSLRERPVSQCSKYCMGINLLKLPERNNRFSVVLRRNFAQNS